MCVVMDNKCHENQLKLQVELFYLGALSHKPICSSSNESAN